MADLKVELPKMGESVAEATITTWLKSVGDSIEEDEPIVEIATDKVDSEVPAPCSGKLKEILFNEGDVDSNVTWELLHHACMLLASVQLGQEDRGLAEALSTRADRLLEGLLSVRLQEDAEKSEAILDEFTVTKGSA